jgi:hypothetical protein
MLDKLRNVLPDFDRLYADEVMVIERTCAFGDAEQKWSENNNQEARMLIKPFIKSGLKWRALYFSMWFPYSVYKRVRKIMGAVVPIS